MAHKKIDLGAERPEPEALKNQRRLEERIIRGETPLNSERVTPTPRKPVDAEPEPAAEPEAPPLVATAPRNVTVVDPFLDWMHQQPRDQMIVKGAGVSVAISVFGLNETDTHVHAAYDAKNVLFALRSTQPDDDRPPVVSNNCMTVELGFEDRLTLWFRDRKVQVLFANGICTFPGWPFHIISFFKAEAQ